MIEAPAGSSDPRPLRPGVAPLFVMIAAFSTYFCMYAFRKPFTVGEFKELSLWGIDYKIVLVLAQVAGYTLSKFAGIKVVSEMPPHRRIACILAFIGVAELALILFGVVPHPYNFVFLFMNGLPLGMIWGLVFSFLEGRRQTEFLGAGLCCSFIVASGFVKSVGSWLIEDCGVTEFWMPALTGGIFAVPLLISLAVLSRAAPPDQEDQRHRRERSPMSLEDRRRFVLAFRPGLILLVVVYALLNALRDFRDTFAKDLWVELGVDDPAIFTMSEIPIAVVVMVTTALMMLIRDNRRAVWVNHGILIGGGATVVLTTAAYQAGALAPIPWMILVGLGMYLAYIAYHTFLWERLIATTRQACNVGFLMYICDAFGYLASVGVLLYKSFGAGDLSWLQFFIGASYSGGIAIIVLSAAAWLYFRHKLSAA